MPPRLYIVALIVLWVGVTLWFLQRELWPQFRPGAPPPYVIDFVDKVQKRSTDIMWRVTRNGVPDFYQAQTWVEYQPAERCYDLLGQFQGNQKLLAPGDKKLSVDSKIRVTRDLELRRVEFKVTRQTVLQNAQLSDPMITTIGGDVVQFGSWREGRIALHWQMPPRRIPTNVVGLISAVALRWQMPWKRVDVTSEPAEVPLQGIVFNPFHPPGRLPGLHAGRRWTMPMIDPVGDPALGIQNIEAEVLPQLQPVSWEDRNVPCWVVVCRHAETVVATLWVRESDGNVMRQDAFLGADHWQFDRHKGHLARATPGAPARPGL